MLSKNYRLGKTEVERVYKKGIRQYHQPFLVRMLVNQLTHNRYAVIIPKAIIAKAFDRNRLRRKIYLFLQNENISGHNDILISLKQKADEAGIDKALKMIISKVN